MFVSFLMPHIDRGAGPLFHWTMLAQMASFDVDEIVFLGDDACFDEACVPFGEILSIGGIAFRAPSLDRFRAFKKVRLPEAPIRALIEQEGTQVDAFRVLLTRAYAPLTRVLEAAFRQLDMASLEAVCTWCNCPSLNLVAERFGIPVIHNEVGPLRGPRYVDTVYFDFKGVNGNTEAAGWRDEAWLRASMEGAMLLSADELRGRLLVDATGPERTEPRSAAGVALQVEDDSNLVAHAKGWNSARLISLCLTRFGQDDIRIRTHPEGRFVYRGGLGLVDDSVDSVDFLSRIDRLYSINSSLLAEALLWDVPYRALGDAPVSAFSEDGALADLLRRDRTFCLNVFFLAYLVPAQLLFDPGYYRWRLQAPRSLAQLHQRHLDVHRAAPSVPGFDRTAETDAPRVRGLRPGEWTKTRSVLRRLQQLQAAADEAYAERAHREQHIRRLEDQLQRKQAEAETVWAERAWYRERLSEVALALGAARGESDAARMALADSVNAVHAQQRRVAQLEDALRAPLSWRERLRGELSRQPPCQNDDHALQT